MTRKNIEAQLPAARQAIRLTTTESVLRSLFPAIEATDPAYVAALVTALVERYDRKAERRAERAADGVAVGQPA